MDGKKIIRIASWALYDLANQFFALNIIALYFVRWVTIEQNVSELVYAAVYALSTLVVALLMPWLGSLADARRSYRLFLTLCTLVSVAGTLCLSITRHAGPALFWFALANFGCQAAVTFYNALLPSVTPPGRIGLLSGLGKLAGYLGAIVCLLLSRPVFERAGYAAVFQLTGWLFLVFSLPCLLLVPDPQRPEPLPSWRAVLARCSFGQEMRQLGQRIAQLQELAGMRAFFKAVFFGLAGVQVVMLFMTVYVTRVFGLSAARVNVLLAIGTLFAMLGSVAAGMIGDRVGHKSTLAIVLGSWIPCLLIASAGGPSSQWVLAALGGLNLGATWVSARSLALTLMPQDRVGEMFGLYNLTAVAAGVAGPVYWGLWRVVLVKFDALGYRLSLAALVPLIMIGLWFLRRVPQSDSAINPGK